MNPTLGDPTARRRRGGRQPCPGPAPPNRAHHPQPWRCRQVSPRDLGASLSSLMDNEGGGGHGRVPTLALSRRLPRWWVLAPIWGLAATQVVHPPRAQHPLGAGHPPPQPDVPWGPLCLCLPGPRGERGAGSGPACPIPPLAAPPVPPSHGPPTPAGLPGRILLLPPSRVI